MRGFLSLLRREQRGGVIVEFAAAMPVLVVLLLGGAEFARFAMLNQKTARVAGLVADYVAQEVSMSTPQMTDMFAAAQRIAEPFDLANQGTVIVTTVEGNPGGPTVLWQSVGGGGLIATSSVGSTGGAATLPAGLTVDDNESVVVTEVFFDFQPLFMPNVVPGGQLYYQSFNRPRQVSVLQYIGS